MPISKIPGVGLDSGSSGVAPSNLSTGAPSWDGSGYLTSQINSATAGQYAPMYFFRLNSGLVGANVNTAQNIFGVGVTLSSSTVYAFEAAYKLSKSAGTTSHTIGIGFGGSATVNNIGFSILYPQTIPITNNAGTGNIFFSNVATNQNYTTASTTAGVDWYVVIRGTVSINAGGTFIPQYTLSAAPGGAYTTAAGSYFLIYPISAAGANTNIGGWA